MASDHLASIGPRQPRCRYDGLDLLRFFAALSVLLFHYAFRGAAQGGYTTFHLPPIAPYAQYGYLGVELFFIISGFVITMSSQGRTAGAFARARFLRLYPAFIVAMTLTALLGLALGAPRFRVGFTDWLANLPLFAPVFGRSFVDGVYWSLVLEVIFYAWVALFIKLRWFETRRAGLILFWLALSLAINCFSTSKMLHRLFLTDYASLFTTGMILFDLTRRRSAWKLAPLLALAFAMSIAGVLERANYDRDVLHATLNDTSLLMVLLALHVAILLALALPQLPRLAPVLGALGALSYPLYLLHQHAGYMLLSAVQPHLGVLTTVLVAIAAVLGASAFVGFLVEPLGRRMLAILTDKLARLVSPGAHSESPRPAARDSRRLRVTVVGRDIVAQLGQRTA
jgi:peptidoglycan/LPS O-acetylase OafA/YrhL